jgi:hypothetical protein
MRSRPEAFVVGLLAVLTLGVTTTSATLALQTPGAAAAAGPAASLPPVLFSPEPPAPVSPVRADLAGPGDDAVGLAPAPPAPAAQAPVKPAAAPPRVRLTLAYALTRGQGRAVITYTATVKNEASMVLQGLTLASHVPTGTVWRAAAPCRGDARPLEQVHSDQSKTVICVPLPRVGVDAPETHAAVAVFDRPVAPGASISASWTVEVRAPGRVVNHVHLTGPGIEGQSPQVAVDVP